MFGTVALDSDAGSPEEIRIPFQVKSSLRQGRIFLSEHQLSHPRRKIIVVVVNDFRTDEGIKDSIQENVGLLLRYGQGFFQSRV